MQKTWSTGKDINGKREKFKELCMEEKCIVLYEILHFFQCQSVTADLKLIEDLEEQEFCISTKI